MRSSEGCAADYWQDQDSTTLCTWASFACSSAVFWSFNRPRLGTPLSLTHRKWRHRCSLWHRLFKINYTCHFRDILIIFFFVAARARRYVTFVLPSNILTNPKTTCVTDCIAFYHAAAENWLIDYSTGTLDFVRSLCLSLRGFGCCRHVAKTNEWSCGQVCAIQWSTSRRRIGADACRCICYSIASSWASVTYKLELLTQHADPDRQLVLQRRLLTIVGLCGTYNVAEWVDLVLRRQSALDLLDFLLAAEQRQYNSTETGIYGKVRQRSTRKLL